MEIKQRIISPQPGYQTMALSSPADIVIGGAAAGVGKTYSLLLDAIRHVDNPEYGAVVFRRLTTQIKAQGGLWDDSNRLYPSIGGTSNKTDLKWQFPSGAKVSFTHLEHEKNVISWQGAQIPFIGFDELTHFSKEAFFYLLSRNRSTCGVKPCVRATCNPDPDSWVAELVSWWIGEDGYPIPERQGVLRYFVKDGDSIIWGDTPAECIEKAWYFLQPLVEPSGIAAENFIKSLTFIGGSLYDNKELLTVNPQYLANLAAQDEQTRLQLLQGNWKVSLDPSDIYDYNEFRDIFNNEFVPEGEGRITVDVAMSGKDKLIIYLWKGFVLYDFKLMDTSTGKDVIEGITAFQTMYSVPNRNVTYDADGVGAFIGGLNNAFISGSRPFHNGSKSIQNGERKFKNLKAQCYFLSGERVGRNEIYVHKRIQNRMYDDKRTFRQVLMEQRKAIKKAPRRDEEPEQLIPKSQMKGKYLNGESPDALDCFMMVELFGAATSTRVRLGRSSLL